MTRFPRVFASAIAASMLASPISAQGGLGGVGGVVGGVVGGARGTVGNTVGGLGNTVGGLSGTLGGFGPIGGVIGGFGNTVGGIAITTGGRIGGSNGLSSGQLGGFGLSSGSSSYNPYTQRSIFGGLAALDLVGGPDGIAYATPQAMEDYREARIAALIDANPATLDRDSKGDPVRKRELIASDPDAASLVLAARAGFRIVGDEQEASLGIRLVTLAIPKRMNVRQAMKTIRKAAPALQADFNHIYEPSGGALVPVAGARLAAAHRKPVAGAHRKQGAVPVARQITRIAMIDGGVAAHPALARANIVQQGFAGPAQPTGHGTAVGSLLVGEQGPFHGAARGAQLFVGDIYGGNPAAGSATAILRALSWAVSKNPSVINISLVGPDNAALARAIAAAKARGIQVVAAVGNDGPAAPAQYPASYPGVVSVTGVDSKGRALPEAGVARHLDFAAPGADMIAAFPGDGYTSVRGTSFAAPLAAARLALTGSYQRLTLEARPGTGKVGRGIVCAACRVDPKYMRRK